jgi:hypothetical protein
VGFVVSLRVGEALIDPDVLLTRVAASVPGNGIEVDRRGNVVRFTAPDSLPLIELAGPLAGWWLEHEPTPGGSVALRFAGPHGVDELTYCRPDLAIDAVRSAIAGNCGRVYGPGEAPGPVRRLTARLVRLIRAGFTATELVVTDDDGVLAVALAGRDLDDRARSIEFQTFDPAAVNYDPDDDEGYCVVNEDHIPIYGGVQAVRLGGRTMVIRLAPAAARAWGLRSTRLGIKLRLTDPQRQQLRTRLQRIFASSPTPPPDLSL